METAQKVNLELESIQSSESIVLSSRHPRPGMY